MTDHLKKLILCPAIPQTGNQVEDAHGGSSILGR